MEQNDPNFMKKSKLADHYIVTRGCGSGCLTVIVFLVLLGMIKNSTMQSIIFIIFAIAMICDIIYIHKEDKVAKPYEKAHKEKRKQHAEAIRKRKEQALTDFRNSIPNNTKSYLTLEPQGINTYKLWYNLTPSDSYLPTKDNTQLLLFDDKSVAFLKAGQLMKPHYYLATINFKPNVTTREYTTSTVSGGKAKGRVGSALIGGALLGPVGAAIGASRKRKITDQNVNTQIHHESTEHATNAYLQLVTTDFKHVKQIKLTNVKTSEYNNIDHNYMISDLELRILEKKHGLLG